MVCLMGEIRTLFNFDHTTPLIQQDGCLNAPFPPTLDIVLTYSFRFGVSPSVSTPAQMQGCLRPLNRHLRHPLACVVCAGPGCLSSRRH
jgi:hypothetical protein